MKNLLLTTALVAVAATGATAQTAATNTEMQSSMEQSANVPAFLVSNFTGKSLYTLDTDETRNLTEQRRAHDTMSRERSEMRWESSATFTASRDAWEDIGNIDDVVLTKDGEIRGVLIDVGGFLGFGARTVMVDLDDLYFVADDDQPEDISDFNVVASMSRDQLEALPEWDDSQLEIGFQARSYGQHEEHGQMQEHGHSDEMGQHAHAARTEVPDGYRVMDAEERTADRLMGADVYGREGEDIATVDDLILGSDGSVTDVIVDVGGFLGMGSHTVALPIDAVDILWSDSDNDVRVQVPMTEEELESLPEYES